MIVMNRRRSLVIIPGRGRSPSRFALGRNDRKGRALTGRSPAGFLPRNCRNETTMIDKTYQPSAVEGRIYAQWDEAGAFRAGRPERRSARPYCIVIPPPNVTGSLHMGHALNNTLQDVLARFERMRGRDVLWQPGTDHAGIATQMVVERQLMERQQPPPRVLGREKVLQQVWARNAEALGATHRHDARRGGPSDRAPRSFPTEDRPPPPLPEQVRAVTL